MSLPTWGSIPGLHGVAEVKGSSLQSLCLRTKKCNISPRLVDKLFGFGAPFPRMRRGFDSWPLHYMSVDNCLPFSRPIILSVSGETAFSLVQCCDSMQLEYSEIITMEPFKFPVFDIMHVLNPRFSGKCKRQHNEAFPPSRDRLNKGICGEMF